MSCEIGEATERLGFPSLHLSHSSLSNPSIASPASQLILQPFRCITNVTAHSSTLLSLLLRHRLFTYVTWRAVHPLCFVSIDMSRAHSPTFPSLHLRHNSFFNPSVASPTSQLILQPYFRFSYVTGSSLTSPDEPSMHYLFSVKKHEQRSYSNFSVTSPTSQLILQPFRCFTYVTPHSSNLLSLLLRHRHFTYVTWRAVHPLFVFCQET